VTIVRETDATRINAVVNHEAVRPWVTMPGQETLDLSDVVADPRNVVLMTEDGMGGIVFHQHEPGIYEAHTQFLPEARGRAALAAVHEMIDHMFVATDCMELLTRCPAGNRPAEALARAVGGVLDFERAGAWPKADGAVDVRYYAIRYHEWVRRSPGLPDVGHWFHERLEAENARLGHPDELHDDDPAHDRHVGAAVSMILCGQPAKGVTLYNRWARFAGYMPVAIVQVEPLVLDILTHLVLVLDGDLEVLECR
jgi:RimJ/RimL family protein N-acetyltransferase